MNGLVAGRLPESIDIVVADLAGIANRAKRPLSDQDRDQLRDELQGLRKLLAYLLEIAEWIEDEAGAARGETALGRIRTSGALPEPALPPEIATAVQEAESDASTFIDAVAKLTPALERGEQETILAWLKRVRSDISHLEAVSNRVVQLAQRFTDMDRQAAQRQGHTRFLKFLDECERVLRHVAARHAISTGLVSGLVERLLSRLSLTDAGEHAAARLDRQISDLLEGLKADQMLLERQADNAINERLANAVTAAQLPSWTEILGHGDIGDGGPSNLAMLLMAFVDYSGTTPDFEPATRQQLKERMDRACAAAGRRRLSRRQFDKWLDKSLELKIIFKNDRAKKSSRRLGDKFSFCEAGIRKYRRHLVRPQP
jgi:hypothetical protein